MNTNPPLNTYLEQATAGLRDDPELRLDVQAELAAHVEDKAEALRRTGVAEAEAMTQAVTALGEITEVATGLERGNRGRLRRRAWLRRGLRFGLVPAAVLVAVLCSDLHWAAVLGAARQLGSDYLGNTPTSVPNWLAAKFWESTRRRAANPVLTATPADLWQSEPANPIYFADYITHEVATKIQDRMPPQEDLLARLAPAATVDPDNARYDYLRAAVLLSQAVTIDSTRGTPGPDGKPTPATRTWEIHDRARLDQAMAELAKGLRKPEYRRYGQEMLKLKLAALGPPRRMLQHLHRISLSAGTLLPDLGRIRELARATLLYGDLLATEGRLAEARLHLDGWQTLATQLNADTWTLIDCLVVTATAGSLPEQAARTYDRLGLGAEASRTRAASAALGGPGQAWRERRQDPASEAGKREHRDLLLYGGILTSLLLPALNEWPDTQDYAASRRLEYVVAMEAGLTLVTAVLLVTMLGCLVISLRWRWASGGAAIPILLLPTWQQVLRQLAWGVGLPLALYAVVVLWVPGSGQSYSVRAGLHKVAAEWVLLVTGLLVIPAGLAAGSARARCRELRLEVLPAGRGWWAPLGLAVVATAACWWLPVAPTVKLGPAQVTGVSVALACLAILALSGLVGGLRLLLAHRRYGLYAGSLARTLIPGVAAAVILLCLVGRPWLLQAERHYLAQDRILMTGPDEVGFSRIENQLTERLRQEVSQAAARLEPR